MGALGGVAPRRVAAVEVRRRWRSLLVLGVLVGLAAGVGLAATAGARRSTTAYPRMLEETNAADAVVFPSTEGIFEPDFSPYEDLSYIEAMGTFSLVFFPEEGGLFVPAGDWLQTFDRPRVLDGRHPDPDEPDEVLLSVSDDERFDVGLGVGDEMTIHPFSLGQLMGEPDAPPGPEITLEIVGISRGPFETSTIAGAQGSFFGTPAFLEAYGDQTFFFSNLMVDLEHGKDDIPQLAADTLRFFPDHKVPVQDLSQNVKRVTNGTDLEARGLLLFALAVALTATLIVGQALVRSVRASAADVPVLRAIGLTRGALVVILVLPHLLAVATALVVATAVTIGASPRFPIGLARRVDPDPGVHVDWLVLAPGLLATATLMIVAIVVTAVPSARRAGALERARPSRVALALARSGLGVTPPIGASLALEPGRGRRALPTRPALIGSVIGVLGVIAAFTLSAGLDDATGSSDKFGQDWDIYFLYNDVPTPELVEAGEAAARDDDVEAAATYHKANLELGDAALPTFAFDQVKGTVAPAVLEGRGPVRAGEILLGPATAKDSGLDIGDELTLAGRTFEVVGLGLVPNTPHSQFDQGAWVAIDDLDLFPPAHDITPILRVRDGVDIDAKIDEMAERVPEGVDAFPDVPDLVADQRNLLGVRPLPRLFAAFTLFLALGSLAHVTTSVLRRRRGELAVLRTLGITPRQAWWCLSWQATILGAIGIVLGLPLGVAVGRSAWRTVAEATPMVYDAPLALFAVVLTIPVTIALANVVAALPGWRAARLRPAEVLRTE